MVNLFPDPLPDYFTGKASTLNSNYYLSDEIGPPGEYIEWFENIRNAGENETITIHINSPGGNLYTAIQFLSVLSESKAKIVMSVEGICASAATIIFLQGHQYLISQYSSFMFHNYSGGTFGKGGEMADQILFEKKWAEVLFKNVYRNFLSEKEIEAILEGKDLWMTYDQVVNKLEERSKKEIDEATKTFKKSRTSKKNPAESINSINK